MRNPTLVLGGSGKIGRRVVRRLAALDVPVRIGSRSGDLPFDWRNTATWRGALQDVDAVFLSYYPDVASPDAAAAIESFTALAVHSGARRLVMLSRRGSREAEQCDAIVRSLPIEWTLLRSSWFAQNFSEGFLLKPMLRGEVALPLGEVREPFVDAEDVADVAVAALTEHGHLREIYDLTGARLWTFRDAVEEIARATRRRIRYVEVSLEEFAVALAADLPPAIAGLTTYVLAEALERKYAAVAPGVPRALGRMPRDFSEYVRDTAATELWNIKLKNGNGTRS
jgi:uncharacterized protein YbjT (DUF2867 family)